MCELIRASVEFAIGQLAIFEDKCDDIRISFRLDFKPLVKAELCAITHVRFRCKHLIGASHKNEGDLKSLEQKNERRFARPELKNHPAGMKIHRALSH